MSAAVLKLPTAAPAPVAQRQRRGPLPKAVRSLGVYRADQEKGRQEQDADNIERVKKQFIEVLARVLRGEVTGVAILERRTDDSGKKRTFAFTSGELSEDLSDLRGSLETFIELSWLWADEDFRKKQEPDSFVATKGAQS